MSAKSSSSTPAQNSNSDLLLNSVLISPLAWSLWMFLLQQVWYLLEMVSYCSCSLLLSCRQLHNSNFLLNDTYPRYVRLFIGVEDSMYFNSSICWKSSSISLQINNLERFWLPVYCPLLEIWQFSFLFNKYVAKRSHVITILFAERWMYAVTLNVLHPESAAKILDLTEHILIQFTMVS